MSGHNGIKKYAECNRDGQLLNFQTIGASAQFGNYVPVTGGLFTPLLANRLLQEGAVSLGAGLASPITFPTALTWRDALEGNFFPLDIGSCVRLTFTNETALPQQIDFPGVVNEGNPLHNTTMRTCDGTNTIIIPACTTVELNVCTAGVEDYVVTPIGAGSATQIVTQQVAYDNSLVSTDNPTILIDDATPYEFKVQEGSIRTGNLKLDSKRDINGTAVIEGVHRMAPTGTYTQRLGRPLNSPLYNNVSEFSRNTEEFTDTANATTAAGFGVRSQFENSNFSTGLHGSKTEGRPMVTDVNPSVALADPLIVRGDGSWTPVPLTGRNPDDPNTGWKVDNYSYRALVLADNTTTAPPTAVDGGSATWSQFGVNHGISPWNVQLFNYPANTHFAPNLNEYHLGGFILQNGPVNGNANPATTTIDLSKNLSMTYWTGGISVERMASYFEIFVNALEYQNPGNTIAYRQLYLYCCSNDALIFLGDLQQAYSFQSNNNPATHPPPNITVAGDPRFDLSLLWTNGANQGAVTNRKFFVQIYVRVQWQAIFNPT